MSLFGTIQQSAGALQAAQVGLQVVGNNIANANTPGFIRERLEQIPAVATREGSLIKGTGVRPIGVTQVVDKALIERLYAAKSALAGSEEIAKAYTQLEELTNDLEGNGLSSQLTSFNNALHELSTQPGDSSLRDFIIAQGESLASRIQSTRTSAVERQVSFNNDLQGIATQINRLTERIAKLNVEIATIEGGGISRSDATGLRDQRYLDLEELATYVNINVQEQESGTVNVFVGGDYLVSNGISRDTYSAYDANEDGFEVRIIETDSALQAKSGKLAATLEARGAVFGDYLKSLDDVARGLIRSVNEIHSQGQGRTGFDSILSTSRSSFRVPLNDAGLSYVPKNGTFDMSVVDLNGQVISNHRIDVRNLGQIGDSTVESIVAQIDAIEGLSAHVTSLGEVSIESDSPTSQFTFGEDSSGFLAAIGLNTFFQGTGAIDIEINRTLVGNSDLLAISAGGIDADTEVLNQMVDLVDRPLESLSGSTLRGTYDKTIANLGQQINLHESASEGLGNFFATLQSQHLAITGVNIDEESIRMITYQRAFQASSRVISTANEMLDILMTL
jgi:flagellar hook-associated protein 1